MVMVKVKRIKKYYYTKLSRNANPQTSYTVGGGAAIATRFCHYAGVHSSYSLATAVFNGVCVSKSILKRVRDISRVPARTLTPF